MAWKRILDVFIEGEPKGQPRPRAFAKNGKARVYSAATAEGWKGQIALAVRDLIPEEPLAGPVMVDAEFVMKRPKNHVRANGELKDWAPNFHLHKPDRDNLDKVVLDTLTTIGLWEDDCQVVRGSITKRYASPGERTGMRLVVEATGE